MNKEGHSITIERLTHQEDIPVLNVYIPTNNFKLQNVNLKGDKQILYLETDTSLSEINRIRIQKV